MNRSTKLGRNPNSPPRKKEGTDIVLLATKPETNTFPDVRLMLPRISFASLPLMILGGYVHGFQETINNNPALKSNVDFGVYEKACFTIEGAEFGNAFFITKHYALTCKHVVGTKSFFSRKLLVKTNIQDCTASRVQPIQGDIQLFEAKRIVDCDSKGHIVIPQLPVEIDGEENWKYNCALLSRVPSYVERGDIHCYKYQQCKIQDMNKLKQFESGESDEIVDDLWEGMSSALCNHNDLIVSHGLTCSQWRQDNNQGHSCASFPGYSGSIVRFLNRYEYVVFPDDPENEADMSNKECSSVPIFHAIHDGASNTEVIKKPKAKKNCILTTHPKFILLYCLAITNEKKEYPLAPIFPNPSFLALALNYLKDVRQVNSLKENLVATIDATIAILEQETSIN